MDSDDFRFWAIILGAIGVAFAAVIGSSYVVCHHIERMAELGYEEEPVPGSNRLMWRRCTPPPPKVEPKLDLAPVRAGAQLVGAAPLLHRCGHEPYVGGEVMGGAAKAF